MRHPTVSVVVPTITGREEHYDRCVQAYSDRSVYPLQVITIRDQPTCGQAWNLGAEQAYGEYLHFTADDLEPHEGWDVAAVECVERGYLPAPRVLNAQSGAVDSCGRQREDLDEGTEVVMSVVPFLSAVQWAVVGPVLPVHYFSDNWISWRAGQAGIATVVCRRFAFTHHWAQPGRGAGMGYEQRMAHDRRLFQQAVREAR